MKRSSFLWGLIVGLIIFAAGAFFIARIYSHPTALAQKIAETDSVTVTNQNDAFGISITGDDARKIAQAIATANRGPLFGQAACAPFLRLEFYKGPNLLASVETCSRLFWTGKTEYLDQTGTLQALEDEYLQRRRDRDSKELVLPATNVVLFTNRP
jgi:hypothetical protein